MRSTLARSVAAVGLGVAVTLVPAGVALADNHIAPPPDFTEPFSNEANQPGFWEDLLLIELDIVATCEKIEPVDDPFIVPDQPSADQEWSLLVVKGGAGEESNEGWLFPEPGWEISHSTAGNSHVIVCTSDVPTETETTTPTTPVTSTTTTGTSTTTTGTSTTTTGTTTSTTPVTGPVVETDRPAGGDMSQVGLFAGAAALLAGATALVLGRRRQSAEH